MSSFCALCYVYARKKPGSAVVTAAVACSGGCGVAAGVACSGGCLAAYCSDPCRREHWAQGHGQKCGLRGRQDRGRQVWGGGR